MVWLPQKQRMIRMTMVRKNTVVTKGFAMLIKCFCYLQSYPQMESQNMEERIGERGFSRMGKAEVNYESS